MSERVAGGHFMCWANCPEWWGAARDSLPRGHFADKSGRARDKSSVDPDLFDVRGKNADCMTNPRPEILDDRNE